MHQQLMYPHTIEQVPSSCCVSGDDMLFAGSMQVLCIHVSVSMQVLCTHSFDTNWLAVSHISHSKCSCMLQMQENIPMSKCIFMQ